MKILKDPILKDGRCFPGGIHIQPLVHGMKPLVTDGTGGFKRWIDVYWA